MAAIFEYTNYRKWLLDHSKEWKKSRPGWTLQRIAQKTSIQASYLTNTLKERVHLNQDQIFQLAKVFSLNEEEMEYLFLLLDWEKCGVHERKKKLQNRIEQIQKSKLKTESYLKVPQAQFSLEGLTKYYLNPELQLIYAFLGIDKYQKNVELIGTALKLESRKLNDLIRELEDLGLIQKTQQGIVKSIQRLHLPKDHPLCQIQQDLMRARALHHQNAIHADRKYSFLVNFTADEEICQKIQKEFLKFLAVVEPLVKSAPSEEAYHLSFNLFPWSLSEAPHH